MAGSCSSLVDTRLSTACRMQQRAAFRSARPASRSIVCMARNSAADESIATRRALLAALSFAPAALVASKALALIPDDDDEDLIIKAKNKRQQKIKEEIGTERQFARTEGFKDAGLAPVQKAVTQLARAGSQLAGGDVGAASGSLGGSWLEELDRSATAADFSSAHSALQALKDAASSGDLAATKGKFVSAVSALKAWAEAAGIAGQVRGL